MISLFHIQSSGEKLSAVCVKSTDGDLDKVLYGLDKEEFQVDTRRRDRAGDGKKWLMIVGNG